MQSKTGAAFFQVCLGVEQECVHRAPQEPRPEAGLLTPLDVALALGRALESIGVEYFLGGSMASSFQGQPRLTNDLDFVVTLRKLLWFEAGGESHSQQFRDVVEVLRVQRGSLNWQR